MKTTQKTSVASAQAPTTADVYANVSILFQSTRDAMTLANYLDELIKNKKFIPTNDFIVHLLNNYEKFSKVHKYWNIIDRMILNVIDGCDTVEISTQLLNCIFDPIALFYRAEKFLDICMKKKQKLSLIPIMNVVMSNTKYLRRRSEFIQILDASKYIELFVIDDDVIDLMFQYNFCNNIMILMKKHVTIKESYIGYCIINNNVRLFSMLPILRLTIQHLYAACEYADPTIVETMLNQKITPDGQCIQAIFKSPKNINKSNAALKINLIINSGYVLTKPDLLLITKHGIVSDDAFVQKSYFDDPDFVKEMTIFCNNNLIFPYGIQPTSDGLTTLIKKKCKLDEFKKFINEHNVKPDIKCLREACKHKAYSQIVKLLTDSYGIMPDLECLINCLDISSSAQTAHIQNLARKELNKSNENSEKNT